MSIKIIKLIAISRIDIRKHDVHEMYFAQIAGRINQYSLFPFFLFFFLRETFPIHMTPEISQKVCNHKYFNE